MPYEIPEIGIYGIEDSTFYKKYSSYDVRISTMEWPMSANQREEDDYFFTSKASLKALPKSINANTNIIMAMPGNIAKYASFKMI